MLVPHTLVVLAHIDCLSATQGVERAYTRHNTSIQEQLPHLITHIKSGLQVTTSLVSLPVHEHCSTGHATALTWSTGIEGYLIMILSRTLLYIHHSRENREAGSLGTFYWYIMDAYLIQEGNGGCSGPLGSNGSRGACAHSQQPERIYPAWQPTWARTHAECA